MPDRAVDLSNTETAIAELVSECELTGRRTVFLRGERPVALLLSYDEYTALRETIEIAADRAVRDELLVAEEQSRRGALLEAEDLLVE